MGSIGGLYRNPETQRYELGEKCPVAAAPNQGIL